MRVLVRKLNIASWSDVPDGFEPHEVPMRVAEEDVRRSKDNAISLWEFDDGEGGWQDEAALAVVGGWKQFNDVLDLAWVAHDDVVGAEIVLEPTDGLTVVADLKARHRDAVRLDLNRYAALAELLAAAVRQQERWRRFTRAELVQLVSRAVKARRIGLANLPPGMQDAVKQLEG